ncbi:kinase-like domain-containing protein [Lophiotrema nucula]|uniref:Kinase-like domain-containing protein n=1 Tax=Lophiotrema nucula TaxID=690887 RepID=A0A6A5ZGZ2_9PLEO|nr:kinase-like domain-containing protein [Lophiotrema nucula]
MSNPPSPPPLALQDEANIPPNAISLFPHKIGPQLFFLPDRNAIMKVGRGVKMAEAEAMRYVSSHSSIPVPTVYDAYEENGVGYIIMSKVGGQQLGEVWSSLSDDEIVNVKNQLRRCLQELQGLRGDFYGALGLQPCEDIFFAHLCLTTSGKKQYGPYSSRLEYNQGLIAALTNSRPGGQLRELEQNLVARISALTEDAKILSHGDLHLDNIIVDHNCNIAAIVDWGSAGFSVPGRDFLEANMRARNPEWIKALADIFPEEAKAEYDILKELDKALVLYSGF